ncbi:unnamed protein product [Prorocentrum cordatum]|uniref:Subtilisin n=1 Tax=Prorocentrum cordatum TaxID=2364126 RepID=A0ABN9UPF3_9DINO|nr:unnamed protein product [Polarella glacialis]
MLRSFGRRSDSSLSQARARTSCSFDNVLMTSMMHFCMGLVSVASSMAPDGGAPASDHGGIASVFQVFGSLERSHVDVHPMQQRVSEEPSPLPPDVVQSEPSPLPPVVYKEMDGGAGKLHVVVEFDNSTAQSRQAQNPYTVYGTSGHCSICGRSGYNCLGQCGSYDVPWANVDFGGINLGTVTK